MLNEHKVWEAIFPADVESNDTLEKLKLMRMEYLNYLLTGHKKRKKDQKILV